MRPPPIHRVCGCALGVTALVTALVACTPSPPDRATKASESTPVQVRTTDVVGDWAGPAAATPSQNQQRIRLDPSGEWSGSLDGCNSQGGRWTLNTSTGVISFKDLATTLVACPDPQTGHHPQTATSAHLSGDQPCCGPTARTPAS
ncbi:META domain-containing protein [Aeromicrobium sp. UC242_57]|uniref:META domain-containing protein n=1 Tax=Aeromicrobium sp. UC242_57 TaxID=3374624 RepID=UPI00379E6FDD